jgi:hypothetical protein
MQAPRTLRMAAGALLAAACWATAGQASSPLQSSPPLSPDTARILDAIEQGRGRQTADDQAAARRLNAEGDRAYRKRDYRAAFKAYANAYPNHPDAYAYIMAGDTRWRQVLQHHQAQAGAASAAQPACSLDNTHFARDLATDLAQHHQVGLALASRGNDPRFGQSALVRRARESAQCLQALAQRYAQQPPSACVDLEQLGRCLGEPLVR